MLRKPFAIWIFGPIASGKSELISRLPLEKFKVVQADAELERLAEAAGLHLQVEKYDEAERALFESLRKEATTKIWDQVSEWREQREDLVFETTGDKADLFRGEIEAGHARNYRTLGCGLQVPLERCLASNRNRRRVLSPETVTASWHAFERYLSDGTYERLFEHDELLISADAEVLTAFATGWLDRTSLGGTAD